MPLVTSLLPESLQEAMWPELSQKPTVWQRIRDSWDWELHSVSAGAARAKATKRGLKRARFVRWILEQQFFNQLWHRDSSWGPNSKCNGDLPIAEKTSIAFDVFPADEHYGHAFGSHTPWVPSFQSNGSLANWPISTHGCPMQLGTAQNMARSCAKWTWHLSTLNLEVYTGNILGILQRFLSVSPEHSTCQPFHLAKKSEIPSAVTFSPGEGCQLLCLDLDCRNERYCHCQGHWME